MSINHESTSTRPTRLTANFPRTPESPIDRIIGLYGEQNLVNVITAILDRYLVMLHRATPKFSDRELCVVIDALGYNWDPTPANILNIPREVQTAITADRLDAKWGIDTDKFSSRLDRTSFYERTTLGEITAAYWRMAEPDSRPQDIINQIKRLIRPASSRITPTARPRRISAHLFHQDPPAGSSPSSSGDDDGEGADPEGTDPEGTNAEGTDAEGTDAASEGAEGAHTEGHDTDPSTPGRDGSDRDDTTTADTEAEDTSEADNPDPDGDDPTDDGQPAASGSPQDPLL